MTSQQELLRKSLTSMHSLLDKAVEGMTAVHHTKAEFLRFLDRVVATQSPRSRRAGRSTSSRITSRPIRRKPLGHGSTRIRA